MLASACLAVLISLLPDHNSTFLLAIGLFSIYLILGGFRASKYKNLSFNIKPDYAISVIMLLVGTCMILVPLIRTASLNIILTVFGGIGIILALMDLRSFRERSTLKKGWKRMHIGKMIGGYIAATTAFIVVNQLLPGLYGWLSPTLIGGLLIFYWIRKNGEPVLF